MHIWRSEQLVSQQGRSLKTCRFDCCYIQDTESFVFLHLHTDLFRDHFNLPKGICLLHKYYLATICVMTKAYCIGYYSVLYYFSTLWNFNSSMTLHLLDSIRCPSCNHPCLTVFKVEKKVTSDNKNPINNLIGSISTFERTPSERFSLAIYTNSRPWAVHCFYLYPGNGSGLNS